MKNVIVELESKVTNKMANKLMKKGIAINKRLKKIRFNCLLSNSEESKKCDFRVKNIRLE